MTEAFASDPESYQVADLPSIADDLHAEALAREAADRLAALAVKREATRRALAEEQVEKLVDENGWSYKRARETLGIPEPHDDRVVRVVEFGAKTDHVDPAQDSVNKRGRAHAESQPTSEPKPPFQLHESAFTRSSRSPYGTFRG